MNLAQLQQSPRSFDACWFPCLQSSTSGECVALLLSTSRPHWQRLPSRNTFYYKCPRHNSSYVLTFVFEFDLEDDVYYFAYW